MSADCWGIAPSYEDTSRIRRLTSAAARQAILEAMGARHCSRGPSDVARLRIVYKGESSRLFARGELTLEAGTRLTVDDYLPPDLPLGYHDFRRGDSQPVRVICAPRKCVEPPRAIWGWAAQLYSARSQASWGIGDLADLRRLGSWSASIGAGCVLINPLSAGAPLATQQASPYSPTSRRFRNPLYLRIEEIPGSAEALGDELKELANAGKALNRKRLIDRASIFALKQRACEKIWEGFRGDPGFDRYRAEQGAALTQFATYCALAEKFGGDWRVWPEEYRRSDGAATQAFATEHVKRVGFHAWLQWLVDEQLARASKEVAIMHDLPIGFEAGGADAWAWQDLLAEGVTVGAPPDAYNTEGQDWGLPPWVPHKLRAVGYQPFIETIRATLRHAGALRIDHVMGLFRLFWIPQSFGAKQGTYVRYRADEMLAILALESHRAGAYIVGEDLGTVEPGVRETLAEHRVLSYRVLWFEEGPIAEYPPLAMVSPATHDLPTIAGLWTGHDFIDQQSIGLATDAESVRPLHDRLQRTIGADSHETPENVIQQTYAALARAPSRIVTASLEDALAVEQRVNMPGTTDQWPNWSLPLPGGLEALEASPLARSIADTLSTRSKVQPRTA